VRPEEVELELAESPGSQRATVESVTFLGPTTHYRVVLESGESLLAAVSGNRRRELLEGRQAWLQVAPGSWRVLEDEPVGSDAAMMAGTSGEVVTVPARG
jgi:ABC-type Fe3+/spermidine/putrescine transport system ATPase subunit